MAKGSSSGGSSAASNAGVSKASGGGKGIRSDAGGSRGGVKQGDEGSFTGSGQRAPQSKGPKDNQPTRGQSSSAQRRAAGIGASAGAGSQQNLLNFAEDLRRKQQKYDQVGIADNQKSFSSGRIVTDNSVSNALKILRAQQAGDAGLAAASNYQAKLQNASDQRKAMQEASNNRALARLQAASNERIAGLQAAAQAFSARAGMLGSMFGSLSSGNPTIRYWG